MSDEMNVDGEGSDLWTMGMQYSTGQKNAVSLHFQRKAFRLGALWRYSTCQAS